MFRSLLAIAVLYGCSAARPEVHPPSTARVAAPSSPAPTLRSSRSDAEPALEARVLRVGFTVSDLDRAARDLAELDFKPGARNAFAGEAFETLLHVPNVHARTLELMLGSEVLELTAFGEPGRPVPSDQRSNDSAFQHIAIVVNDMDRAFARVSRLFSESTHGAPRFAPISPAPQTIPADNPAAGGVRACYFQDADHHALELIWFPPGKGQPVWHSATSSSALFLGIDHSAIASTDTERSLGLYRGALGLNIAGTSLNFGREQEALSGIPQARVRITGLRGSDGAGVEFLQYLEPGAGRPAPADTRPSDLWHWEITIAVSDVERAARAVLAHGGHSISEHSVEFPNAELGYHRAQLMTDSDGHALRLVQL